MKTKAILSKSEQAALCSYSDAVLRAVAGGALQRKEPLPQLSRELERRWEANATHLNNLARNEPIFASHGPLLP